MRKSLKCWTDRGGLHWVRPHPAFTARAFKKRCSDVIFKLHLLRGRNWALQVLNPWNLELRRAFV